MKNSSQFYNDVSGPELPIPEFLQGKEWEDVSWHNDITGSSRMKVKNTLEGTYFIRVWVYHEDPAQRDEGPNGFRFVIWLNGTEVDEGEPEELMTPILELTTNYEDEARHLINVLLFVLGQPPMYDEAGNSGGPGQAFIYYRPIGSKEDWFLAAVTPLVVGKEAGRVNLNILQALGSEGMEYIVVTSTEWVISLHERMTRKGDQ